MTLISTRLIKVDPDTGCWEWQGALTGRGYGTVTIQGTQYSTHRLMYSLFKGPIPRGKMVLHACDNPKCCNPLHLHLGTHQDNMDEAHARNRFSKGPTHHKAKLTQEQVDHIRTTVPGGPRGTAAALAREYGVSRTAISLILKGKNHSDT